MIADAVDAAANEIVSFKEEKYIWEQKEMRYEYQIKGLINPHLIRLTQALKAYHYLKS